MLQQEENGRGSHMDRSVATRALSDGYSEDPIISVEGQRQHSAAGGLVAMKESDLPSPQSLLSLALYLVGFEGKRAMGTSVTRGKLLREASSGRALSRWPPPLSSP